ncbi:protein SMAX1-LIKE 4 [Nicotiana tabacum]|uniref:Protein SMAX1-LIKE 4 n=1 Tax=Nicotiana tabacum TaxID=4097 RepID=A0A1S3YW73_TOBAC|nr:PREDICTED: protein SMAX1-LIKE 4-like [Nicotiana tabacum]
MRTGASNCAVQQTLTTEAASVLKHSLSLARRRGHAQVTPLHVAAILLTSRVSLLRRACLKSQPNHIATSPHHHHPLQCRALELCFNVALNRLPTSPGPLLHGQPCLSNALIAALKRAQAHQRRGCIEQQQQQQPLLAIKVELEQLILSILDDPSVSRVMREAGFFSTAIKSNIEESASSVSSVFQCYNSSPAGIYSTPSSPPNSENPTSNSFWNNSQNPLLFSPHKYNQINTASVDIKLVIDVLLRSNNNKRRNAVIVGDSASSTGGLVAELMGKVERGDVPEELKGSHFIKFQFTAAPLMLMKREEVELNISDLKRKVESLTGSSRRGVIIYTGDLKWTVDSLADQRGLSMSKKDYSTTVVNYYSPVDHLVAEIGRLVSSYNNSSSNAKVWLVATANYQTYIKCQMKQPPLDIQWSLQPISVPSGGLGFSLNCTSGHEPRIPFSQQIFEKKPVPSKEEEDALSCCAECSSNYEREARLNCGQQKTCALYSITCDTKDSDKGPSPLPDWLKPHDIDTTKKDDLAELKRKWSSLCQNLHQGKTNQSQISSVLCNEYNSSGKNYSFNSLYPWWPNQNSIITECKSISFCDPPSLKPNQGASTVPRFRRQQSCHIEFSFSNGNSKENQSVEPNLDSLKISEGKEVKITLALGNSKLSNTGSTLGEEMLKMLQENLPWQMENMHTILDVLMDFSTIKNWLLIQGNDSIGKQRLARVIAKSVFGSADLILCINMRKRENTNHHVELLNKSLRNNEKLVVLVEDVDFADSELLKFLVDAFENGSSSHLFILARTSDNLTDGNTESVIQMKLLVSENPGSVCIDHKRKLAEWELSLPNKTKSPRNDMMEDVSSITARNGKMKKEFTRQLSSNALDLNIKADEVDEEDENEARTDDFSPISSDLTRDTANDQHHNNDNNNPPLGFLDHIKNRLVLNRDSSQEKQMREVFMFKMRRSLEEVCGSKILDSFCLEEMVLEKVFEGCGSFLNSLFDEWLKDIFQTSLQMVDMDKLKEKEIVIIKLCLGKDEIGLHDGFKGSCLPRGIQVSIVN